MLRRDLDTTQEVGADEQIDKISFLGLVTFFTC